MTLNPRKTLGFVQIRMLRRGWQSNYYTHDRQSKKFKKKKGKTCRDDEKQKMSTTAYGPKELSI